MQDAARVGIDLGKPSFHRNGQDRFDKVVFRKKVTRKQLIEFLARYQPCTVVMEACAGMHHMARKLVTLGHEAKLILRSSCGPSYRVTGTTSWTQK
jgi:transposase